MATYSYQMRRPGGGWSTIAVYSSTAQFSGRLAPSRMGALAWRIVQGDMMGRETGARRSSESELRIIDAWSPPVPPGRPRRQTAYNGSWSEQAARERRTAAA